MPKKEKERFVGLDELAPAGDVTSVGSVEWLLQNVDPMDASNSDQLMWDAMYSCITSQRYKATVTDELALSVRQCNGYKDKWLSLRTVMATFEVITSDNSSTNARSRFRTKFGERLPLLEPRLFHQEIHQVFAKKADTPKLSLLEIKKEISKKYYIHRSKVMKELFSSTRSFKTTAKMKEEQAEGATHYDDRKGEARLVGLDELAPGGGVTSAGSVEWILQNFVEIIVSNSDQLMWDAFYSCVTSQRHAKKIKNKLPSYDGYDAKWLNFRSLMQNYEVKEFNKSRSSSNRSRFIHKKSERSVLEPRLVRQAIHQVFANEDTPKLSLRAIKEKISETYYIHRPKIMNELFSSTRSADMRAKIEKEQLKAASHPTSASSSSVCSSNTNANDNRKRKMPSSQTLVPHKCNNKSSKTTDTSYFSQHDQRVSASVQSGETQAPTETNISSALAIAAKSSVQNIENERDYEKKFAEMKFISERERREKEYVQKLLAAKEAECAKLKAQALCGNAQAQRDSRLPTAHGGNDIGWQLIQHSFLSTLQLYVKNQSLFSQNTQARALRKLLPFFKNDMKRIRLSVEDINMKSLNYSFASDRQAVTPGDTLIIPSFRKVGLSQAAKAVIASLANPDVDNPPPCQISTVKVDKGTGDTITTRIIVLALVATLSYERNRQSLSDSPIAAASSLSLESDILSKAGSTVDCPVLKDLIGKEQFVTKVCPAIALPTYLSVSGELSDITFSLKVMSRDTSAASTFFRHFMPNLNQIKVTKLVCAASTKGSDTNGIFPFADESLQALMTHSHLKRFELERAMITEEQMRHLRQFQAKVCFTSCDFGANDYYLNEDGSERCNKRCSASEAPPFKRRKSLARNRH